MATIKDVASAAGVSLGTVDRVLHNRGRVSEETKNLVWKVIEELDYTPNPVAQGLALNKKNLIIHYFIPDTLHHPFFVDVKAAAERRAKGLEKYGVSVEFFTLMPRELEEYGLEKELCERISACDGIVCVGKMISVYMPNLEQSIREKNIPVVCYNLEDNSDYALACVRCNYVDAGRLAAGLAARIGGKSVAVGVFSEALEGIGSYSERIGGFKEEMQNRYNEMTVLFEQLIDISSDVNYKNVKQLYEKYPEWRVAYVADPADYDICRIIHEVDKDNRIQIITNDLVSDQKKMIDDEIIAATICQEPEKQGEKSLNILFDYLAYGKVPNAKTIYTNLSIHIAQNI